MEKYTKIEPQYQIVYIKLHFPEEYQQNSVRAALRLVKHSSYKLNPKGIIESLPLSLLNPLSLQPDVVDLSYFILYVLLDQIV